MNWMESLDKLLIGGDVLRFSGNCRYTAKNLECFTVAAALSSGFGIRVLRKNSRPQTPVFSPSQPPAKETEKFLPEGASERFCTGGSFVVFPGAQILLECPEECTLLRLSLDTGTVLSWLSGLTVMARGFCPLPADYRQMCEAYGILAGHLSQTTETAADSSRPVSALPKAITPENAGGETADSSRLLPILRALAQAERNSVAETVRSLPNLGKPSRKTLTEILSYIHENLFSTLSLAETAALFDFTPQYLAALFKKSLKCTFLQYVRECRLAMGRLYALHTSFSAAEIAGKTGLSAVSSSRPAQKEGAIYILSAKEAAQVLTESAFCRNDAKAPAFADSGKTPAAAFPPPNDSPTASPLRQSGAPAPAVSRQNETLELSVSPKAAHSFAPFWRKLINLGYSTDFSSSLLCRQIEQAQSEVSFEYGRICRVFDLAEQYTLDGKIASHYDRIFAFLDVMIQNGLHPFFELSNKVFRLHLSLFDMVMENSAKSTLEYYQRLLGLLPHFLKTCINRYGMAETGQWRFEVSYINYDYQDNSEDFSIGKYTDCLKQLKDLIQFYIPACRVGAPGFNHWTEPEKIQEFLDNFGKKGVWPDFYTAYLYPIVEKDGHGAISEDAEEPIRRLRSFCRAIRGIDPKAEIWVTEFGSNLSARNLLNDSCYQSAFLIDTVAKTASLPVTALGWYSLSDITFRYSDTEDLLFGGFGLLSDRGIPKPSWQACRLLGQLGGRLLACGTGRLLTATSAASFQLLLCRRQSLLPEYLQANITAEDCRKKQPLYRNTPSLPAVTRLDGLAPGSYLLFEYSISEESGSILNAWRNMDFRTPFADEPIRRLIEQTRLRPRITLRTVAADGSLTLDTALVPQEVRLILIERQLFL